MAPPASGLSARLTEMESAVADLAAAVSGRRDRLARARIRLVDLMLALVGGADCLPADLAVCRREAELVVDAMETLFERPASCADDMVPWVVDTIFRGIRAT